MMYGIRRLDDRRLSLDILKSQATEGPASNRVRTITMPSYDRTSRCSKWYELNLAALRYREMARASNPLAGIVGMAVFGLPGLFGIAIRGNILIPSEVTLIWDVAVNEVEVPEELAQIGFTPLTACELPEFSGENLTCILADRDREVICEVLQVRMDDGTRASGIAFATCLAGSSTLRIKTVERWAMSPLDPPPGFLVQQVSGSMAEIYEAHRRWVRSFPEQARKVSTEGFYRDSHEAHRLQVEHYSQRGVYLEARETEVEKLLRRKRLGWD